MRFEPHTLVRGSVHLLPVLHGQLEFAQLVVQAFRSLEPRSIAVELPRTLEKPISLAVARLPQLSAVRHRNGGGVRVYHLIEPADPLVEAVRLGLQKKVPVHFVDLDLDDYPDRDEPLPDAYAVARIGHRAYYEAYLASPWARRQGPEDVRREAAMAARLSALAQAPGPVLFVCGMAHADRVAAQLGGAGISPAEPLDRARRGGVSVVNLHPESCREVLSTWAWLGADYERSRGATLGFAAAREEGEVEAPRVINLFERVGRTREAPKREAAHVPAHLPVDRQRALLELFREAAIRYRATTGEEVKPYHRRVWLRFLRNWAVLRGRLQPILFQIVVGARAAVDDNFAYELFQLATRWPWQKEQAELPTERLTLEELHRSAELVRFRPRQITRRLRSMAGRPKLTEKDFLQGFENPFSHCSYPPEDMALERFSTYVQKKGRGVLSEENRRVEPFTASLLDGIDMRETLRNWHQGKLYVQELRKDPGNVGSVVVIFDDESERYPWRITWLGEMEEEGDMALYATHPLQQVVGPGICRSEYGGFLLSYPPGRMSDVWSDEVFEAARTRAERLLMAGIEYCEKRLIAYVAKKPPRGELKTLAGRFGKKIVYLPIGQFSPDTLKRMRVFHVLFGKDKRTFAKDYIW
jgi:hypothetical protein